MMLSIIRSLIVPTENLSTRAPWRRSIVSTVACSSIVLGLGLYSTEFNLVAAFDETNRATLLVSSNAQHHSTHILA